MAKYIGGHEYIGQYADKYYLLNVLWYQAKLLVYDKTVDKIKELKVRKNGTVKINNESIFIDLLNG